MLRRVLRPGFPALLLAGACGGGVRLAPLPLPANLAPASLAEATRWADSTLPSEHRDIRFNWTLQDQFDASGGGNGRARLAPPDSIRLDVRGSLGLARAAAFVVGDFRVWAEPEQEVERLVPNYPLFWAMLGIARPPAPGSAVARYTDANLTAWQFTLGQDTVVYLRENGAGSRLIAEVRQGGRRLGRVETKFGPNGLPTHSRLTVVQPATRVELTFTQHVNAQPFAVDTWARPAEPARDR